MGLVDYASDSDSDSGSPQPQPAPAPATTTKATAKTTEGAPGGKKPFRKLIDRSDPKKIRVELPGATSDDAPAEPPAKRARTGGGAFGGFNAMLPPPKNANAGKKAASASGEAKPVGSGLRTGAERGFVRGEGGEESKGPEIPEGMKREEDVKLVGKPLMFKPLSVARKSAAKKGGAKKTAPAPAPQPSKPAPAPAKEPTAPEEEELSLFSLPTAEDTAPTADPTPHEPYIPLPEPDALPEPETQPAPQQTVSSLAQDLNLSSSAHRDLFGRAPPPDADFLTFDLSKEYSRNEELRQSGELQPSRPTRVAVQGGGKHSLRQLVNAVAGQKEVLEEGFARGKEKRREAGGRYGWR